MKKIAVVTSTRAEFGLLAPIIKKLREYESDDLRVELIVTGTHLFQEYGMTVNEIKEQAIRIDHEIRIPVASNNGTDIANNQAEAIIQFARLFMTEKYNAILLLGDRYEIFAVAIAASDTRTPIFHISGGDVTEGAIDDCIRHSITKMSYLHFTTNEISRKRVIQLGENPERVFCYGSTSIDNIISVADMTKRQAMDSVGIQNERFAICTYHPVTLEDDNIQKCMSDFLSAIKHFSDIDFIVTKSNADQGGAEINRILDNAEKRISNLHVFSSLGTRRYLSLMRYALFVMGNSSSGIVETPVFHIPTVNIGDRQKGRVQTKSIINCQSDYNSIICAIEKALSDDMREVCLSVISPYGDGNAAEKIAQKSIEAINRPINLKKSFYNLEVSE